jgi:hypothetical protein
MINEYNRYTTVTDEERRDFLKILGVAGAVGASSVTITEVRESLGSNTSEEFAEVGGAIKTDMAGNINAELIAEHQSALTTAVTAMPAAVESGQPLEQRTETFGTIAEEGWAIYEHLKEAGFFQSTTEHMPAFNPGVLTTSTEAFLASGALTAPLEEVGLDGQAGIDLVAPTINEAEKLSHFHWIASGGIPADHEIADILPPITQRVAGGVLLWLQNLDTHVYQKQILITDEILSNGIWDVQGMAAGFHLLSEGAKAIGTESGRFSDAELGTLVITSIALQEIGQRLLPVHMHWISEKMRDPGNVRIDSISI